MSVDEIDRQVRELFDHLVDLDAEQQAQRLRSLGKENPELHRRVAALLAADRDMSGPDFVAGIVSSASDLLQQTTIDRYELVRRIAAGGMGEVHEALQREPIERRVALKLIRSGLGSPEVVQRFHAERQALSMMNHPAIAQVFDAGATESGQPYFVMELVDGVPIDQHCARRELSIEQRLLLFCRVCDGVEHAHRRGIVHRDLKPSNILVTDVEGGQSAPKIIDFGIAKALDPDLAGATTETVVGSTLGTPAYMSPEQAGLRLEVDTRTDVYSLGVLLYELLVGSRPFTQERLAAVPFDEARRIVREEDPELAQRRALAADDRTLAERRVDNREQLRRLVRGDLTWICQKALEKDPERRYGSVGELAADVRRHLEHQPISAGPRTRAYLIGRFARRHRLLVGASAAVLVALLIGVVGLGVGLRRARTSERLAADEAERSQRVAEFLGQMLWDLQPVELGGALLDSVRRGVDATRGAAGTEQLEGLLAEVNQADVAREVLTEQILERAASTAESMSTEDPLVQARLFANLAETYEESLTLLEPAERHQRRAVELFAEHRGPEDPETLDAWADLGEILSALGRAEEAFEAFSTAVEGQLAALGPAHPDTVQSQSRSGALALSLRRYREAEDLLAAAYEAQRGLLGDQAQETFFTGGMLILARSRLHRYDQAEQMARDFVATANGPEVSDDLRGFAFSSRVTLGSVLLQRDSFREAEEVFASLLADAEPSLGADNLLTLVVRSELGEARSRAGRHAEALELYRDTVPRFAALIGPGHPRVLSVRQKIADSLAAVGEIDAARAEIEATVEALAASTNLEQAEAWPYRETRALIALLHGEHDTAVQTAEGLVATISRAGGESSASGLPAGLHDAASARLLLARSLLARGDDGDLNLAIEQLERSVADLEAIHPPEHQRPSLARLLLLDARLRGGDAAPQTSGVEIARLEEVYGIDTAPMALPYLLHAAQLSASGATAEADAVLQRAETLGAAALPERQHPQLTS